MVRPGGGAWGVIPGCKPGARPPGDPYAAQVEVAVLGPVEVKLDGSPLDPGAPQQRSLLAALALSGRAPGVGRHPGRPALGRTSAARRPGHRPGLRVRAAQGPRARAGAPGPGARSWSPRPRATRCAWARSALDADPLRAGRHRSGTVRLPLPLLGPSPVPAGDLLATRSPPSTRRSASGAGRRTPSWATCRGGSPSGPTSRSCGSSPWRTGLRPSWRSVTTPPRRPSWRR